MATIHEVAQFAMSLPEATEGARYGDRTWFVGGTAFAWIRPYSKADLRRIGDEAHPTEPILAVRVEDLGEKEAVLNEQQRGVFTISHFDNYPVVLIELNSVSKKALRDSILDAWLACAPRKLVDDYMAQRKRPL